MSEPRLAVLRSFLFVAGNHEQRFAKALQSGADAVIFDLEDAVPPAQKQTAREAIAAVLQQPRQCKAYARLNGVPSGETMTDLEAIASARLDGVVLPKAESVDDVRAIAYLLQRAESQRGLATGALDFIALIESAKALLHLEEIAAASPRLSRLAFGAADYVVDMDLQWTEEEAELAYARARLTHASRTSGLEPPIDAVVVQVNDTERFRASARRARAMGFLGKLCIHPSQVEACNEVFTPSTEEIEHARRVLDAFAKSEAAGSAALQVDGVMIDYALVHKARRVLALARR